MTPHVSITLLRTQTDQRLVELIAAGHDRAFDAIVDRYRRPLLRYARRFLHEDTRAEDVVQSAFVSAWTALNEGATVRDLRPWLYRIVHNGAVNVMKKPGRDDAILIEASDLRPGPAAEVEQREDVRQALDTISRLPERQRTALLAVAFDGRSHADVGAELGLKEPAVRQLVSRARTNLRVAATALTPWPVAAWLAGIGGTQAGDTAARVGEIAGGMGAGTLFGGGALKAGALVAAAGAVAVSAPKMADVARHAPRSVATASADTAKSERTGANAPSAAAANAASAGTAARFVSTASGGLTAGARAHRRSGGATSHGWSHRAPAGGGAVAPVTATPTTGTGVTPTVVTPPVATGERQGRHRGSDDRTHGTTTVGTTGPVEDHQSRAQHGHDGRGAKDGTRSFRRRHRATRTPAGREGAAGSTTSESATGDSGSSTRTYQRHTDRVEHRDVKDPVTPPSSGSGSGSSEPQAPETTETPASTSPRESGEEAAPSTDPAPTP